VRDSNPRPID